MTEGALEGSFVDSSELTNYTDIFDDAFKDKPVSREIREKLFSVIHSTIAEVSDVLDIPAPSESIVNSAAYKALDEEEPMAQAVVYKDKDEKIISAIQFSPRCLRQWARNINDPFLGEIVKADVREHVAHETYHVAQAHRYPTQYFNPERTTWGQTHKDYLRSKFEYSARLFALKYITSYETSNWREKVAHFAVGLSSKLMVLESVAARKSK